MSTRPQILALAGSTRRDSFNKRLVRIAALAALEAGADVALVDLRDYPMPLYDQDLEEAEGIPEAGRKLKQQMIASDGFLIASPEYNSSISGVLKNAIDWASRPAPNEPPLVAYSGKTAVLMSASPGDLGGLRGLVTVRSILSNIGVLVLPQQVGVPRAHEAFAEDESLKDPAKQASIEELGRALVAFLVKHKS